MHANDANDANATRDCATVEVDAATTQSSRPPSFNAVCQAHRDELYGTAMRLSKSPSDADDLVQETFLRAYQAWDRFEEGSNARAWLFRILMNSFINGYRKRRRHARITNACPADAVSAVYGSSNDYATAAVQEMTEHSLGDEVSEALNQLSPDYRTVVEMADIDGERYRDIATRLGVPIGTVMSRLFRARRQLEAALRDYARLDYGICRAA